MDQLDHEVSYRVKAAIESAGISIRKLAHKSRITRTTLRRRLKAPSKFTVREIDNVAGVLDVPTASLLPDGKRAS